MFSIAFDGKLTFAIFFYRNHSIFKAKNLIYIFKNHYLKANLNNISYYFLLLKI